MSTSSSSIANLISKSILPFSSSKTNAIFHSPPPRSISMSNSISIRPMGRISNTATKAAIIPRGGGGGGGQRKDDDSFDYFNKSNKPKQGIQDVKVKMNKGKCIHQGLITESLANGMFRVRLENDIEDVILGYISAKIRDNKIMILVGDRVEIEVDHRYDSTKGRIIYRVDNRSHKAGKKEAKKDSKQNNRRRS